MNWKNWLTLAIGLGTGIAALTVTIVTKIEKTPEPEEERNVTRKTGPCRENDTFEGCFWWRNVSVRFASAAEVCENEQSKPAIIETELMFQQVLEEVRKEIGNTPNRFWAQLWTGMTFDPKNGTVMTPDPCYVKWSFLNPKVWKRYNDHTGIVMAIYKAKESRYNGMFNELPSGLQTGVVCQKMSGSGVTSNGPR